VTDQIGSETVRHEQQAGPFSVGAWIRANALGLGVAYGLFGLFGGLAEEVLGFAHDSLGRDTAILLGLLAGAALFVGLRQRALGAHTDRSWLVSILAGVSLAVGVVVGFVIAGPPIDFVLGMLSLGVIGGALQWRRMRGGIRNPGRMLLASVGAWIAGSVALVTVAVLVGDAIDSVAGGGTAGFVAVLTLIGLVGGAVGGAVEGSALRRQLA
jgi:hypothetical protein